MTTCGICGNIHSRTSCPTCGSYYAVTHAGRAYYFDRATSRLIARAAGAISITRHAHVARARIVKHQYHEENE